MRVLWFLAHSQPYRKPVLGIYNNGFKEFSQLKDNLPHNTYQIYVKPHLKNTQMTLENQIFDEKALE